jgi:hypothetical protein
MPTVLCLESYLLKRNVMCVFTPVDPSSARGANVELKLLTAEGGYSALLLQRLLPGRKKKKTEKVNVLITPKSDICTFTSTDPCAVRGQLYI